MPTNGRMLAAIITSPGKVRIENVPVPQPAHGQVLVELEGCGVCASSLPLWEGRPGLTYPMEPGQPGYEGWGRIEALGPGVVDLEEGQRVAMLSDHGYAQYDVAPASQVALLPTTLDEMPFPGKTLGCAMNIFMRSAINPGDFVGIVGIGFLGAVLAKLASSVGASVLAISRRQHSLQMARLMGAAGTIVMDNPARVLKRVGEMTGGRLCDVVIEAAGEQGPLDLSAELTREHGRLIVAGYHRDGPRQVDMQLWNLRGIDVINAHDRAPKTYMEGIKAAVAAVSRDLIDPTPLYTHNFGLDGLGDALNAASKRPDRFVKALIMMAPRGRA